MKRFIGFLAVLFLVVACGGGYAGPELGDFPAITKKESDAPFTITAPSSRSPAPMSFTSSDTNVATISGTTVTIKGVGVTTITASQPSDGAYGATSKSTTLTVTADPCPPGQARVNGVCSAIPTCIAPATLVNNQCIAPTLGATTTSAGGLSWMGVTRVDTWANANAYCKGTIIDGLMGWRLPTPDELTTLFTSGAIAGHHWTLGNTWSSTMSSTAATSSHVVVDLVGGTRTERDDTVGAYVTCVRPAATTN